MPGFMDYTDDSWMAKPRGAQRRLGCWILKKKKKIVRSEAEARGRLRPRADPGLHEPDRPARRRSRRRQEPHVGRDEHGQADVRVVAGTLNR